MIQDEKDRRSLSTWLGLRIQELATARTFMKSNPSLALERIDDCVNAMQIAQKELDRIHVFVR